MAERYCKLFLQSHKITCDYISIIKLHVGCIKELERKKRRCAGLLMESVLKLLIWLDHRLITNLCMAMGCDNTVYVSDFCEFENNLMLSLDPSVYKVLSVLVLISLIFYCLFRLLKRVAPQRQVLYSVKVFCTVTTQQDQVDCRENILFRNIIRGWKSQESWHSRIK